MADVVFILGAGCSVHAGAPVMGNFLDRARDLYLRGEVLDRKQEFETVFQVVNGLQHVHSKARLDLNNIESVFSAVDFARTINRLPGFDSADAIESAVISLGWLIVRTLERSMRFEYKNGFISGTSEYRHLVDLIEALRTKGRPTRSAAIVTFNYDIALDITLAEAGVPFSYCLGTGDTEVGLPLLKLHGSLNWFKRADDKIGPFWVADYMNQTQRAQGHGVTYGFAEISKHAQAWERRDPRLNVQAPVIVPPTWSKGHHYRAIENVWRRAAEELSEARYVFVLGYSLPETDQFFRLLFALGAHGKIPLSRFEVYDPNKDEVAARFRALLGGAALDRFYPDHASFAHAPGIIRRRMELE